jgi:acyl carrier protein
MDTETGGTKMELNPKIKDIIVEQLGVDPAKVKPEASFIDDLGADSLDIVELVMAMEEEFDMEIPDEDAEKLRTVSDVMSFLQKKGKA